MQWRNVFYISGAFYAFSTVVYAILGDGTEQIWSKGTDAEQSNKSMPEMSVVEAPEQETEVEKVIVKKL